MADAKGPFDRLFDRIAAKLTADGSGLIDKPTLEDIRKAEDDAAKRRAQVRKELEDGARPRRGRFSL